MKKSLLLLLFCTLIFAGCSKDDDNGGDTQLTNKEKLVIGSPWVISNLNLLTVYDDHNTPFDELEQQAKQTFIAGNFTFIFNNDNTGTLSVEGFGVNDFNYNISGNDTGQSGFNMNIDDLTATNCSVTTTTFKFTQDVWLADGPDTDVQAQVELVFSSESD